MWLKNCRCQLQQQDSIIKLILLEWLSQGKRVYKVSLWCRHCKENHPEERCCGGHNVHVWNERLRYLFVDSQQRGYFQSKRGKHYVTNNVSDNCIVTPVMNSLNASSAEEDLERAWDQLFKCWWLLGAPECKTIWHHIFVCVFDVHLREVVREIGSLATWVTLH